MLGSDSFHRTIEHIEARHDDIRDQLSVMEAWLGDLPLSTRADQRATMHRVVDYLQRYVLLDCAIEEEHVLVPSLGSVGDVFRLEHGFIRRWTAELAGIARSNDPCDDDAALRFRTAALKLFGLLETHLHVEETIVPALLTATSNSSGSS